MNLRRAIGGFLLSFIFLFFFAYIIYGSQWISENYLQDESKRVFLGSVFNGSQNTASENITGDTIQPTEKLEMNATSAISVESNLKDVNKVLFKKNSDLKLPIASLTKLMTAVVVLDNYNLSDTIVVDKVADSQDPMKQDVKLGDIMPVESFLDIMLVESSNKSAYALAELIGEQKFVGLMNRKAKNLGLQNTFFADSTGLSDQNISTASDLTKLAEYILNNYPKIADISRAEEFYVPGFGKVSNTNQLLGEIPDIICSKTGFTIAAKGCLLLVINNPKNSDYLISIILGADDRFSEMKKLVNWSSTTCVSP